MNPPVWQVMRAIDDAGLDVYQYRVLMHILRVGESWEGLRTIAEKCDMSIGKASEVRNWLDAEGWIKLHKTDGGRMAYIVNLDALDGVHEVNDDVADVHDMNGSVHEVNTGVHEVNVSIPNKNTDEEGDPVLTLAKHFTAETGLFASRSNWADSWELPLTTIYERAGSIDDAKQVITKSVQFARDGPKQYTITSPMSITTIAANIPTNGSQSGTLKVGAR